MTNEIIVEMAIESHASTRDAIRWAMAKEREACAMICEARARDVTVSNLRRTDAAILAERIRNRGQA